jgi:hypothetical protein
MPRRRKPTLALLSPDAKAIDVLRSIYRDASLPLETRMSAAIECLPYESPRMIALGVAMPSETTIKFIGGLPQMPGSSIRIPYLNGPNANGGGTPDEPAIGDG